MESIERELLLRDLNNYGYSLVQTNSADIGGFISKLMESTEGRLLEGAPVVITNILLQEDIDLFEIEKSMQPKYQKRFRIFSALAYLFSFWIPDSEKCAGQLFEYLKKRDPSLIESIQNKIRNRGEISVGGGIKLSVERLERTFKNYVVEEFVATEKNLLKKIDDHRQAALLESLSELFTKKQQELIFKMLNKEDLSKTDREYFSRVVKKRLKALCNSDLQSLAISLVGG